MHCPQRVHIDKRLLGQLLPTGQDLACLSVRKEPIEAKQVDSARRGECEGRIWVRVALVVWRCWNARHIEDIVTTKTNLQTCKKKGKKEIGRRESE